MKKLIIYYNFIFITLITLIGFLRAESLAQIVSAVLFFPLAVYFWRLVIPKQNKALILARPNTQPESTPASSLSKKQSIIQASVKQPRISNQDAPITTDENRRKFLKLIGTAGITLFLFSIFTKKAHGAFFGSVPGPGTINLKDVAGNKIDPAFSTPTDGYKISQIDDATPSYYGFVEKTGKWFIMKDDGAGAYRYTKGDSDFSTNWTNRASLTYGYFDSIF